MLSPLADSGGEARPKSLLKSSEISLGLLERALWLPQAPISRTGRGRVVSAGLAFGEICGNPPPGLETREVIGLLPESPTPPEALPLFAVEDIECDPNGELLALSGGLLSKPAPMPVGLCCAAAPIPTKAGATT